MKLFASSTALISTSPLVALGLVLICICSSGADELPRVCVSAQADDVVGERLVYRVKELIRKSNAMKLLSSERDRGCVRVIINTMEEKGPGDLHNVATVYSVTWAVSYSDLPCLNYVNSTVGYCGSARLSDAAEGIVARTEKIVASMTPPSEPSASPH